MKLAEQVAGKIEKIDGIEDVFNGITIAGPTIEIVPIIRNLVVSIFLPNLFQFQVQTMMEGNIVGNILEKEQLTNISDDLSKQQK